MDDSVKDQVREKLVNIFGEEYPEDLMRIFWYLDEEDKAYKDDPREPPVWKTLKSTLYSDKAFMLYAKRLVQDTKKAERDEHFRATMGQMYRQMMDSSGASVSDSEFQSFDIVHFREASASETSALMGLATVWKTIPPECQANVLALIPKLVANNKQPVTMVDEVVGLVNKTGGTVVMVTLAAVYLTYDAIYNIWRWYNGEISGVRCVKKILDSTFTIGAGMAGGVGGATIGSIFGPIGTLAGGILGGFISSAAVSALSDRMTQWIFGLPKDEAVENAYKFLGVKMGASNDDINRAFRKLCLKHHPDREGGSKEDFHMLQLHMAVVKQSRGELL